jgi:hypothetical protein
MLLLELIKPVIFTAIIIVGCQAHFAKEVSCIFLRQMKILTGGEGQEIKMLAAAFPLCGAVARTRHDTIFLREMEQLCMFCVGIVCSVSQVPL